MSLPIYLDYAASTPVAPEVAEAMTAALRSPELVANPAAGSHAAGRHAAAVVEVARAQVAGLIHADPDELIFTSGATEADNLAIIGTARFRQAQGRHLVTALTEHKAVLESCRYLASQGWRVTWLKPDADGRIAPAAVAAALEADTILVSLMHANNETGVVQDVAAIGSLCRQRGVLLHVDAAQSAGRLPLDVRALQIDLLSLSASQDLRAEGHRGAVHRPGAGAAGRAADVWRRPGAGAATGNPPDPPDHRHGRGVPDRRAPPGRGPAATSRASGTGSGPACRRFPASSATVTRTTPPATS